MTEKTKSFHDKVVAVMEKVGTLKKDGQVSFGQTNYSYLSEEEITSAVRRALIDEGLVLYMTECAIDRVEGNKVFTRGKYVLTDGEGSYDIASVGEGQDSGDKAIYKALTGQFKYANRQTFCLATGDDPDKIASEQLTQQTPKQAPKSEDGKVPVKPENIAKLVSLVEQAQEAGVMKMGKKDFNPELFGRWIGAMKNGKPYDPEMIVRTIMELQLAVNAAKEIGDIDGGAEATLLEVPA